MAANEPAQATILVDGQSLPIAFRVNRRARRLILRLDDRGDRVLVTLPPGVSRAEGRRFAEERTDWLARRLSRRPETVAFEPGATIPILGIDSLLRLGNAGRGPAVHRDGELVVKGAPEHFARRVRDWLKAEARRQIEPRAIRLADALGEKLRRVTIRDTRSRWGSCSTNGSLNFSWRLVLAPDWVLEYVVAHEVAHLVEHNHGPRFWALVERINGDADKARAWLNVHGAGLHRYG